MLARITKKTQVPAYWPEVFGVQDWVYSGVFAELKKTIAISAMDMTMPLLVEPSLMLIVVSMCIVGDGVAAAIAIVGEVIFMPDISMV
jgi:hypothetical protein